jgi:AcrR family transcriptional regulator
MARAGRLQKAGSSGRASPRLRSSTRPRRTQEERRRETKDKILRAAIDLLVEEGYAGFSTIAVAARAGVSRGARENYYRTKYDLIEAAWHAALQRAETRSRQSAARSRMSAHPVDDFLASAQSFFLSKDYLAMIELALAARTDRRLARIFHDLFRRNRRRADRVWVEALSRAGYSKREVERYVALANCVFRGVALMAAWRLSPALYRPLTAELRALAPAMMRARERPVAARKRA